MREVGGWLWGTLVVPNGMGPSPAPGLEVAHASPTAQVARTGWRVRDGGGARHSPRGEMRHPKGEATCPRRW